MKTTYALNDHDDYTLSVEATKDRFGKFKTFEDAKARALEIMKNRYDTIGLAIDELEE